MKTSFKNLKELLACRAEELGDKTVYTFLGPRLEEEDCRTYQTLHAGACTLAARICRAANRGERALLLYPPGLDYLDAFWATLYSGVIAVTAYPPSSKAVDDRLLAVVMDCTPCLVLTTNSIAENKADICRYIPALQDVPWLCTDTIDMETLPASVKERPFPGPEDVAFLQYTSGSTSAPKGVMVTHRNILSNEALIREGFGFTSEHTIVGWLPMYHDMGLIGNILQPVYAGASCCLMSPFTFLKRPLNWLEAVSRYRAYSSGGPNFAYDLAARSAKPEEVQRLNLTSWQVAFNGAEPVRDATLKKFAAVFAPAGFSAQAFFPCYGLAEATLFVCGSNKHCGYETAVVDK